MSGIHALQCMVCCQVERARQGGDGVTIEDFNKDKINQIKQLREELQKGDWKPQPYLQIAIPKTKGPNEK